LAILCGLRPVESVTFRHPLSLTLPTSLPPSSEGPILAPQALSPKWTPLHLPCASWLAVYIGLCYRLAFALASLSIIALQAQASTLFSRRTLQVMNIPPLRTRPVPPRPHWTEPVSREETLARRERFQKIGWLPPNHKPQTKKDIATAKRLWDRYVICACHLCLQYGITERTANGMLSGIVSILVSMPIHTFSKKEILLRKRGVVICAA
jgi:hypothetical protein